ncbi:ENR1 protein, partial [Anhinga anhinga]|nr:ENR1 protein [Anhinga anhinga]
NMTERFICNTTIKNPYYQNLPEISKFWENITAVHKGFWKAPKGLFWICRRRAYSEMPPKWRGSCTLGVIQPGFFLLPGSEGDDLGVPV